MVTYKFRCRHCGKEYTTKRKPSERVTVAEYVEKFHEMVGKRYDDVEEERFMRRVHQCRDRTLGVSDLIGIEWGDD